MTFFPDESCNIPEEIPKEAREPSSFFELVIFRTTKNRRFTLTETYISCFEKGYHGLIKDKAPSFTKR